MDCKKFRRVDCTFIGSISIRVLEAFFDSGWTYGTPLKNVLIVPHMSLVGVETTEMCESTPRRKELGSLRTFAVTCEVLRGFFGPTAR